MENALFNYTFLIFGIAFAAWGFFIMGSDQFYEWWRDRYWKEKGEGHLKRDSLVYNRYIRGVGTLFFGSVIIYGIIMYTPI